MSGLTAGARILASWMGGAWQPATVLEVNPVSGLLRVRFDDGRETWLSNMNARAAPNVPPAAPSPAAPPPPAPVEFRPVQAQHADPSAPPPGSFNPYRPGGNNGGTG